MKQLIKISDRFIQNVVDYIAFDEFDKIPALFKSCLESDDAIKEVFLEFGSDEDINQLQSFIDYQKRIDVKVNEAYSLQSFNETYYELANRNLSYYSTFKWFHSDDFLKNDYPLGWDDSIERNQIELKLKKDLNESLFDLMNLLEEFSEVFKGINIQKCIGNLNSTYETIKTKVDELCINVFDYDGTELERFEEALNIANSLELEFKESIGKPYPTSIDDIHKAITYKLSIYSNLLDYFENEETCKTEFSNIYDDIQLIIETFKQEEAFHYRDFINKTDDLKRREEIFYLELQKSIKAMQNIALVAIMEDSKARKNKWVVWGAYCLDKDDWEFGAFETLREANSIAYDFAKKFQDERNLLTRFISMKNNRENDYDD